MPVEYGPKITVITPVLNAVSDIEECLKSVAQQTYPLKEHLIIDGVSIDGTLEVVSRYAAQYPHVKMISEPDDGIYDAMNKGISHATGDWLYFLGSDDALYDTNVLEQLFGNVDHSGDDILYGNVRWGDTDRIFGGPFSLLRLMDINIAHQAMFFKKSVFDQLGMFNTTYRIWADYLLNIQAFNDERIKIVYIDMIVARYGTNGISSQIGDRVFIDSMESIFTRYFPQEYVQNWLKQRELVAANEQLGWDIADKIKILAERDQWIVNLQQQVVERDQRIVERDRRLAKIGQLLARTEDQLADCRMINDAVYHSISWRITSPLRWLHTELQNLPSLPARLLAAFRNIDHPILELQASKEDSMPSEAWRHLAVPVFARPTVSIVVLPTREDRAMFACLQAIAENTYDVDYEVIVVDDEPAGSFSAMLAQVNNIRIVPLSGNQRGGAARQVGIAAAKTDQVVVIEGGWCVQDDWLVPMLGLLHRGGENVLVGAKLVGQDGKVLAAGGIVRCDGSISLYGAGEDADLPQFNYVKDVDFLPGGCMLASKDVWAQFAAAENAYATEVYSYADLSLQMRRAGVAVRYQPKSVAIAYNRANSWWTSNDDSLIVPDRDLFTRRWKSELEADFGVESDGDFWARNRSRGKKTIVAIDHYVPHYDKDAGSRSTFDDLKLFLKMGLNVIFIGDNFFKHEPYTTTLEQMGIEVLYGHWYSHNWQSWMVENSAYLNFFYLNRPHISIKYLEVIKKHTFATVIYFGHDLHYLREMRQYEFQKDPSLLISIEKWRTLENSLFSRADVVLTVSEFERTIICKDFPLKDVRVKPLYIYDNFIDINYDASTRKNLVFVGGFNHKPNVDAVLWFTQVILPKVIASIPGIVFQIIGSNPPPEILELSSANVLVRGYVTDKELAEIYSNIRMVVIPLRYGAGVKGKTVEAMYHGVPMVTTSQGIEGLAAIDQIINAHDDEDEFAQEVVRLYSAPEKLRDMSNEFARYVQRHFSEESASSLFRSIFE